MLCSTQAMVTGMSSKNASLSVPLDQPSLALGIKVLKALIIPMVLLQVSACRCLALNFL